MSPARRGCASLLIARGEPGRVSVPAGLCRRSRPPAAEHGAGSRAGMPSHAWLRSTVATGLCHLAAALQICRVVDEGVAE